MIAEDIKLLASKITMISEPELNQLVAKELEKTDPVDENSVIDKNTIQVEDD